MKNLHTTKQKNRLKKNAQCICDHKWFQFNQQTFTCLSSKIETLDKGVEYVQSLQQRHQCDGAFPGNFEHISQGTYEDNNIDSDVEFIKLNTCFSALL